MTISLGLLIFSLSMYLAQASPWMIQPVHDIVDYIPKRINLDTRTLGKMVTHNVSPNMNDMKSPRNGLQVTDTKDGFKISPHGYLYEKLGEGYAKSINLTGKAFRFKYSLKEPGNVKLIFMEKRSSSNLFTSPLLKLVATHLEYPFEAATKKDIDIPLSEFVGADASKSYAIMIYGPLTVHRIEVVKIREEVDLINDDIELVDACEGWVGFLWLPCKRSVGLSWSPNPQTHEVSRLLSTTTTNIFTHDLNNKFHNDKLPLFMNLNLGGGGETWDMRKRSFKIIYSADKTQKRRVYVQQEVWTGKIMRTRLFMDKHVFHKGKHNELIIKMKQTEFFFGGAFQPLNIHGLSIEGPINIHSVDIISECSHFNDPSPNF